MGGPPQMWPLYNQSCFQPPAWDFINVIFFWIWNIYNRDIFSINPRTSHLGGGVSASQKPGKFLPGFWVAIQKPGKLNNFSKNWKL